MTKHKKVKTEETKEKEVVVEKKEEKKKRKHQDVEEQVDVVPDSTHKTKKQKKEKKVKDEEKLNIEIPNDLLKLFSDENKNKFVEAKPVVQEIPSSEKMEEEENDDDNNTVDNKKKNKKGSKKDNKKENPPKPKKKKDDPEKLKRTLFVGNISLKYLNEPKPFLDIFKVYGEIESYRFRSVPVTGVPIERYDQKVLRKASIIKSAINEEVGSMNAYIVYKNEESVEKALVENEKEYDFHHIRVDKAIQSNHKQEKNRTIFIGNLPFSITNEELRDFLYKNLDKDECEIENLRIVRDENTNQSKGIAYVVFKDETAMSEALLLNGSTFKDRQIRITKWKAITKRKDKNEKFNASNIVNMKKNKKFKGGNKNNGNNGKVRSAKRIFTKNDNSSSSYSGKKTKFNPKSNVMKKITDKLKKNKSSNKPNKPGKSGKSNKPAFKKRK